MRHSLGLMSILALTSAGVTAQDEFQKLDGLVVRSGGFISGKSTGESPEGIKFQVDEDLILFLPKNRYLLKPSVNLEEYRRVAAALGNDANRHYEMGQWCSKERLAHQSKYHYRRAIELDPDHSKARAALRYVKDETTGKWVLYEDQQRALGYVLDKGGWRLPEAIAQEKFQKEADLASKKWIRDVARLKLIVERNNSKSAEALKQLEDIKDPNAAAAIAKELEESRFNKSQSQARRLMWVRLLGRFRNTVSVQALVKAGIEEPDPIVREACMEQLQEYGASSAVATYLPILKDPKKDNRLVTKALSALNYFPDRALVMDYVDALVTTHVRNAPQGGNMQVGQANGRAGLGMGGKQKIIQERKNNPGALALLEKVEPGVNFNYDQQKWRAHFAAQLTAYQGDLRRDP